MVLGQQVDADFKAALKAKDELSTSCLRLIRAALKNREKDLLRPLEESEQEQILRGLAKQRKDSIEQYLKGNRPELARREEAELKIIERYLPEQLGEEAIVKVLDQVFAELNPQGPKEMGMVMKAVMAKLAGKADGKLVSKMVAQRLSG